MKVKINPAAERKLKQLAEKKTEHADKSVRAQASGKSPREVEKIARNEYKKAGLDLNDEGVKMYKRELGTE